MSTFDSFNIQVKDTWGMLILPTKIKGRKNIITLFLAYRSISRIGQWTRLAIAKARNVVFVTTEILSGRPDVIG